MAWIEYHTQLRDHWKIQRLADYLSIDYHHALGLVSCLWLWCVDYASDGNVTKFSDAEIRRGVRTNVEKFGKEALKKCELIDDRERINDWKDNGIKYLESTRLRVRKHRLQKRYCNVTVTPTLPNLTLPNHTNKEKTTATSADTPKIGEQTETKNPLNPIQKIVTGWKILNGIEKDDKAWDKANFKAHVRHASNLLDLFGGDVGVSLDAMDYVFGRLHEKQGLDLSLAGVVRNVNGFRAEWLERKAKTGVA